MQSTIHKLALLTSFFATGTAAAQATRQAKAVAPLIDDVTVAVFHVDLSRIQAKPLLQKAAHWFPAQKSQLEAMTPVLSSPLEKLDAAGVTDVYAVVSLAGSLEPEQFLFLAIPLSEQSDEKAATQMIRQLLRDDSLAVERLHGTLMIGTSETVVRLRDVVPDERPELPAAFEALEGTVAQAILLPPKHTRRVVEEIMPDLPDAVGGGPSSVLTDGILWAAVGVQLEPRVSVRGVVQSRDDESAGKLVLKWDDFRRLLTNDEKLRREIPHFGPLLRFLTPEARDSRLVLQMDEESAAFTALIKAVRGELGQ